MVEKKPEVRACVSGAVIVEEKETRFKDGIRRLAAVLGARW
ncbi:MAG: hypothetical protein QXO51_02780 [Halobacteria archaeon]